jgi:hypothetical protein
VEKIRVIVTEWAEMEDWTLESILVVPQGRNPQDDEASFKEMVKSQVPLVNPREDLPPGLTGRKLKKWKNRLEANSYFLEESAQRLALRAVCRSLDAMPEHPVCEEGSSNETRYLFAIGLAAYLRTLGYQPVEIYESERFY